MLINYRMNIFFFSYSNPSDKQIIKALVREIFWLRSRSSSIFPRPCARTRAQNHLSAAQFCAQFSLIQQFFVSRQVFMGNNPLILKNNILFPN